nr:MAG TPA: hypothetical protein [Caudoviricetes sp.]
MEDRGKNQRRHIPDFYLRRRKIVLDKYRNNIK